MVQWGRGELPAHMSDLFSGRCGSDRAGLPGLRRGHGTVVLHPAVLEIYDAPMPALTVAAAFERKDRVHWPAIVQELQYARVLTEREPSPIAVPSLRSLHRPSPRPFPDSDGDNLVLRRSAFLSFHIAQ